MRFVVVLALLAMTALTAPARASLPQVEIKAQSRVALSKVRVLPDGQAEIRGQLTDKLTGDGLPAEHVLVQIGDHAVEVPTQPDGNFVAVVPIAPGPATVTLTFAGSGAVDAAAPLSVTTDPSRAEVTLTLGKTGDAPEGATLVVTATVEDAAVPLDVAIEVGPPSGDKLTPLRSVRTGTPFLLPRKQLGGAGAYLVRATFAGDASRQAATIDGTIDLSSGSTTTMELASTSLAFEDDLVASGRVRDDDGAPVPRAAVTLSAGDKRLAQGVTAEDGTYKLAIEAAQLGTGQLGVQVQADPGKAAIRPSRSTPIIITVSVPQPVPVSYTFIAFVATFAAAGGFFAARGKPWRRLRPAPSPAAAGPEVDAPAAEDVPAAGGLVANRPSLVATLRRPYDDTFSGVVRDTVRGRSVPEAVVSLRLRDEERECRTRADGGFGFAQLHVGEWTAEVAAPGHVTERFVVSIPHRGELRDVRIDLVPVREKVFQLYRRAAEPVLPEPRLWGVWSPRQIVDHVKARRPSPALAELTELVEEIYFSSRLAPETVLAGTSERVDAAIRERVRVPRAPSQPSA